MAALLHLDDAQSAFFLRQLEHVQARILEVPHKPLKALTLIPADMSADTGAETITYRTFDMLGVARIIADYASDFPRVDIYGYEKSVKVKSLGSSYGYSVQEIRRARKAGLDLETRRARAARLAIDQKIDKLVWNGDKKAGLQGFLKYPGTLQFTLPADGSGSTTQLINKDVDKIIRDLSAMQSYVRTATNGVEDVDTVLMTLPLWTYLSSLRMPTVSEKTLLTWLMANFPTITKWEWVNELKGAGTGGTDMLVMYKRDPEYVNFQIPQTFEQFAPQLKGLTYEVYCHARVGGVIMYRPQSCVWCEGA